MNKLNSDINAILREPEMAKRLTNEAAEPVTTKTNPASARLVRRQRVSACAPPRLRPRYSARESSVHYQAFADRRHTLFAKRQR